MMRFDGLLGRIYTLKATRNLLLVLFLFCSALYGQAKIFLPITSSYQFQKQEVISMKMLNKKEGWISSPTNIPNGGFSDEHFWIRIHPDSLPQSGILIIENAHIDTMDVYIYDKEQHLLKKYHSGDRVRFKNRYVSYYYFNFYIPKETATILIHSRTEGSFVHPLKMISAEEPAYFLEENSVNLIFMGVLLLALVVNLMFATFLKDSIYIYYVMYLLGIGLNYCNDNELLFQYLWPEHPDINRYNVVIYCIGMSIFFFSEKFLQLKENFRGLYIAYQVLYGLFAITAVVSIYSYAIGIQIFNVLFTLAPVTVIVTSLIVFIKKREVPIMIFLLAWTVYMLCFIVYSLAVFNVIPYFSGAEKLLVIGTTLEIIMLMMAVVYKFNIIREEGMRAKENLIKALYENEKILNEQNILLEEKIKERTLELEGKNIQLEQQSKQLEDQNKLIESTNRLLKDHQAYLEQLVQERTEALTHTNQELVKKNDRLEQFSFVAAHNIRGPLSTMLGLSNLYYMEKNNNQKADHEFYLQKIKESGEKLDAVVHALGAILDLENPQAIDTQQVNLERFVKEITATDDFFLKENNVTIHTDFTQLNNLNTVPVFLTSIFNQLIENTIKFKGNTNPEIFIHSTKENGRAIIVFKDNSQGIDMKAHKHNVFQPFRRLNPDDSGNGIGLYLVQRQIEAMHGTITLDSKVGSGCTYTMSFSL